MRKTDQIEEKPYFEAVENFLRELQHHDVKSLQLVALCNDPDTFDVIGTWGSGPNELASAAGLLQMHASLKYTRENEDYNEDAGDDDGDDDDDEEDDDYEDSADT